MSATFRDIYDEAYAAGYKAGIAAKPQMMQVRNARTGQIYEPFPICGFAEVRIKPATSAFARWLKKEGIGSKHYHGGLYIWISDHGQSYDAKLAHARAMADVFKNYGFDAWASGRLD